MNKDYYGGEDSIYEGIKIIQHYNFNFCLGNVLKYILRAGKKTEDPLEDLLKAKYYIEKEIEFVTLKNHKNNI